MEGKAGAYLSTAIQEKIARLDPATFEDTEKLDDINKAEQGKDSAFWYVTDIIAILTFYISYFAFMGWYLFSLKPVLASAIVIIFLPTALAQLLRVKFFSRLEDDSAPVRREYEYYETCMTGREYFKETRLLGGFFYFKKLYQETLACLQKLRLKATVKSNLFELSMRALTVAGYCGILWMLFGALMKQEVTVGAFAAVFNSLGMLYDIMEEIICSHVGEMASNVGSIRNYLNFLDMEERTGQLQEAPGWGDIVLENVSFSYPVRKTEGSQSKEEKQSREEGHSREESCSGEEGHSMEEGHSGEEKQFRKESRSGEECGSKEESRSGEEKQSREESRSKEESHLGKESHSREEGHSREENRSGEEGYSMEEGHSEEKSRSVEEGHSGKESRSREEGRSREEKHSAEDGHSIEDDTAEPVKYAVKNVSLTLHKGETLAVVGENGSGKSTLIRLIAGLYLPEKGCVKKNGVDTRELAMGALAAGTSAVFQKYQRYQMTLAENITISDPSADCGKAGMDSVCDMAGVETGTFPEGYETMLSREFDGIDLSGGQWQRVAIARGFFRSHDLIILDEPTAAIDPYEETMIYNRFAEIARNKTAVIVTHRLGSVKLADRILVMKDGEAVQTGTHEELIAWEGEYKRLYEAQEQWYSDGKQG